MPTTDSDGRQVAAVRDPILTVRGLSHAYGTGHERFVALGHIDLDLVQGEFVTLVGPSGCGKTTLLKCISGLIRPTAGTVTLNGRPVDGVPPELGLVFQEYGRSLFPWLTVERNVAFPLQGLPAAERKERVQESLAAVDLAGIADRYPWQLSGGMQQRVAIARALAYRPEVLLMDEPFGSVDAYTRAGLEDLMLTVRTRFAMTILLVTHDIDESVYLGDRIMVLSRSPSQVIDEVAVPLPTERHQVSTRELPEFIETRSHVAREIFNQRRPQE